MSRLFLMAFVSVMGLTLAALDYVNQSRILGLGIGELSGADYLVLLEERLGLAPEEREAAAAGTLSELATDLAKTGVGLGQLGIGGPIDMAAFERSLRPVEPAGAPSGTVAFSRADAPRLTAGVCVTNGAFKRCRVGN